MEELKKRIKEVVNKYPNAERAVMDVYELCVDEIENGESRENEIELALAEVNSIERQLDKESK